MDPRIESLEAELALAKLEAGFVEAKLDGSDTREQRDELQEARRSYREKWRTPTEASAQPAVIETTATNQ